MNNKIIRLSHKDNYRIIAISDVHGHKSHLVRLIEEVGLRDDDHLVFVGDMINRGVDSYEVYEYMKELVQRDNTYFLKGNHEFYIHHHLEDSTLAKGLLNFVKIAEYENILTSICRHEAFDMNRLEGVSEFQNYFQTYHADMLNFIKERPIILEIDQFRFVHGGYETHFDIAREEGKYLKYDYYNDLTTKQPLTTIVGHWPACNLRKNQIKNDPYYNEEKNLIFIDGGLGVKSTGELNALIIDKNNGQISYDHVQVNGFKKKCIIKETSLELPEELPTYVNYPHYEIELVSEGEHLSVCLHKHSQRTFSVPSSLLEKSETGIGLSMSYCNKFFRLKRGDEVALCKTEALYSLVKFQGEFGWVATEQIE